jgi:large subunit ribosomal protein L17e
MSNPCHIEMILTEADEAVAKAEETGVQKLNSRQRGAQRRRAIASS